jgi:predicted DNA-binding protein (MmcQ/YjbR family)
MISLKTARELAIAFEAAVEQPHFEKPSYRVNKKIFLTLDEKNNRACLKLSEMDQDIFSAIDKNMIYPVPNKWGKQGWTYVELKTVKKEIFKEALTASYCNVAPKGLAEKYLGNS